LHTAAGTQAALGANYYFDGTNARYLVSAAASSFDQLNGGFSWLTAPSGTAGNAISFTQAMTLEASGNLLIGGTDTSIRSGIFGIGIGSTAKANAGTSLRTDGRNWLTFTSSSPTYGNGYIFYDATAGAERARITSGGDLLVGKPGINAGVVGIENRNDGQIYSTLSANTNSFSTVNVFSTGAGAFRFYVGMGGTVYATSTSISAISDRTLKENIRDLETGLTEVMALKPRRFDWKNGDAQNVAGFVAQEVEEVLPELVTDYVYNKDEDGNDIIKKSLKMGDILPTLVKAIQEQQAIITALTARVTALEGTQP